MARRKNCLVTQFSDTTLAFFAQVVSLSSLLVKDFPSAANLESLLGATVCFHFWHIIFSFKINKLNSRVESLNPRTRGHRLLRVATESAARR